MSNCKIYFQFLSDIAHAILKIFLQYGVTQCRMQLLCENRMLGFLANLFWPDHVSAFNPLVPGVH